MSVQFVVDLSHHKPGFDFAAAKRQGVVGVLLKATDGADFTDELFASYLKAARATGLLVAAYHYQQASDSVAAQLAHLKSVVPRDVPLAIDVERNSGNVTMTRQLVTGLQSAGYRVLWTYIPRWYWEQIGSPSLAGLPPLWSSRYPNMVVGTIGDEFADVPDSYWSGYGGLPVSLLQFTSSGAVGNYGGGSIDVSAFRGTYTQLAAYWNGGATNSLEALMAVDEAWLEGRLDADVSDVLTAARHADAVGVVNQQHIYSIEAKVAGMAAALDALTKGTSIAVAVDAAVAAHMPTADQVAAAQTGVLREVLAEVLGTDNKAQADAIVDALVERLQKGSVA